MTKNPKTNRGNRNDGKTAGAARVRKPRSRWPGRIFRLFALAALAAWFFSSTSPEGFPPLPLQWHGLGKGLHATRLEEAERLASEFMARHSGEIQAYARKDREALGWAVNRLGQAFDEKDARIELLKSSLRRRPPSAR